MQTLSDTGVVLSLAGRAALVTGGSRGIGTATVCPFRQAAASAAFSYQGMESNATASPQPGLGTEMSHAALSDPATSKKVLATIPVDHVGHVDEIAGRSSPSALHSPVSAPERSST